MRWFKVLSKSFLLSQGTTETAKGRLSYAPWHVGLAYLHAATDLTPCLAAGASESWHALAGYDSTHNNLSNAPGPVQYGAATPESQPPRWRGGIRLSPTGGTTPGSERRLALAAERLLCINTSPGCSLNQVNRSGGVELTLRRNLGAAPAYQGAPTPPQSLPDGASLLLELEYIIRKLSTSACQVWRPLGPPKQAQDARPVWLQGGKSTSKALPARPE